ncbi:MAG: hypothetical protein WBZ36_05655 [Candidatus Nitrosopolaris sp.]
MATSYLTDSDSLYSKTFQIATHTRCMDGSLCYHFEQELEIGLRDALGLIYNGISEQYNDPEILEKIRSLIPEQILQLSEDDIQGKSITCLCRMGAAPQGLTYP